MMALMMMMMVMVMVVEFDNGYRFQPASTTSSLLDLPSVQRRPTTRISVSLISILSLFLRFFHC